VNDRNKTTLILGGLSLTMFSPLAMVLIGYQLPMFQNLGFERNSIASPIAWILAAIVGIVYVSYTLKAIPFIASMQRENLFVQTPWDSRCSCGWNRRRSSFSALGYGYADV